MDEGKHYSYDLYNTETEEVEATEIHTAKEIARALAARRKSHGPKADRRWYCTDCGAEMGTVEMRRHMCQAESFDPIACLRCGHCMTRSQTRAHRCEEGK